MNWKRGLFRLWIGISALWLCFFIIVIQRPFVELREIAVDVPGGSIVIRSGISSDSELKQEIVRLLRRNPENAYIETRIDRILAMSGTSNGPEIIPDRSPETINKLLGAERAGDLTEKQMNELNRLRGAGLIALNLKELNTVISAAASEYRSKDNAREHIGAEAVILIILLSLSPPLVLLGLGAAVFWVIRGFASQ